MWHEIAAGFEKRAQFPHCICVTNGKLVRILKPEASVSMYYNYRNYFCAVLLAVGDSNYCVVYVDIGSCGKYSDSKIFDNSAPREQRENESCNLPRSEPLPGTDVPVHMSLLEMKHLVCRQNYFGCMQQETWRMKKEFSTVIFQERFSM
jgi:hypothetical protein